MKTLYTPVIRTRTAELRGYSELSARVKAGITPIFELTKSRKTKRNLEGDCWKTVENLVDLVGENDFVLDLTSLENLQDGKIDEMLYSPERGFEKWTKFIAAVCDTGLKAIPMIHYMDGEDRNFKLQINRLSEKHDILAFRVGYGDSKLGDYLTLIDNAIGAANLLLVVDCGYLPGSKLASVGNALNNLIRNHISENQQTSILSSGFPPTVTPFGTESGEIPLTEVLLFEDLIRHNPNRKLIYGDYASIHPEMNEGWGQWIPRVDYPLDDRCFYYRFRRDDGSYESAASEVVGDSRHVGFGRERVWGEEEIQSASRGTVNGASPSYWISVRVNLHITRQFKRLR